MIAQIQTGLFPELKPELRHFRSQLLRKLLFALLGFFGIWFVHLLSLAIIQGWTMSAVLPSALLFLAYLIISLFLLIMVRKVHVLFSAYLLAVAMVFLASLSSFRLPSGVLYANAALFISIIVAAAIISRPAAYLFVTGSILLVIFDILLGVNNALDPGPWALQAPPIYSLLGFSFVAIALARILSSLARQVETTIGNLQLQAEKLAHLAHTDSLTGLANRRYLFDQLKIEFARSRRYERTFCLLFIDLDNFKLINDRYGHLVGDEALNGASKALQTPLRATDMLARVGGDEFAVLLPETDLRGGIEVIEKLQSALRSFGREFEPEPLEMTFSAGLSQLQQEDITIDQILTRADDAQYLAKRSGKGELRTDLDLEKTAELEALELRSEGSE